MLEGTPAPLRQSLTLFPSFTMFLCFWWYLMEGTLAPLRQSLTLPLSFTFACLICLVRLLKHMFCVARWGPYYGNNCAWTVRTFCQKMGPNGLQQT